MRTKRIFGIVISVVTMIALGTFPVFAASCDVATFTSLPPNTSVTSATLVTPPANVGGVPITAPFCRVQVTNYRPYDVSPGDADIYSEVWLPLPPAWNGKYLGLGNGGSAPGFQWATLNAGMTAGYATANTTMGTHENAPPGTPLGGALDFSFGTGHPQRVINFGYLATHLMTISAKDIIKTFYGSSPAYSYFTGCSTGGQQSMSEAQRYPEDYDGIAAGSGAFNRVPTHEKAIWMYQTNQFLAPPKDFTRDPDHYIPPDTPPLFGKWALITKAVIAACDGLDGVLDGIVDDPRQCNFDANTLLCPTGTDSPTCLTPGQVWTINQLWRGTFNPRTGKQIVFGMTKGSESDPSIYGGITGIYFYPLAAEGPKPLLPLTPLVDVGLYALLNWAPSLENFDLQYFDWEHDTAIVDRELGPILNATDPDLSRFKARGGKLIMYHGWADPLVYSLESPNYYEEVLETMGGLHKVKNFARLFMVPGMGHCGLGGPFPAVLNDSLGGNYITNGLGSLVNWVEKGEAPDLIIASKSFASPPVTRTLCPYPEVARYSGSGSTNDATNFLCVPPVTIRIEPETINLKSKGVLTAFITVPAGFDVRDWGISNLQCQGAPMMKGSVSGDGQTYIAKFNTQDLNVAAGNQVTFKVQGLFNKGGEQALLLGFDVVKVIK